MAEGYQHEQMQLTLRQAELEIEQLLRGWPYPDGGTIGSIYIAPPKNDAP